jgi:hypothetical protein
VHFPQFQSRSNGQLNQYALSSAQANNSDDSRGVAILVSALPTVLPVPLQKDRLKASFDGGAGIRFAFLVTFRWEILCTKCTSNEIRVFFRAAACSCITLLSFVQLRNLDEVRSRSRNERIRRHEFGGFRPKPGAALKTVYTFTTNPRARQAAVP